MDALHFKCEKFHNLIKDERTHPFLIMMMVKLMRMRMMTTQLEIVIWIVVHSHRLISVRNSISCITIDASIRTAMKGAARCGIAL